MIKKYYYYLIFKIWSNFGVEGILLLVSGQKWQIEEICGWLSDWPIKYVPPRFLLLRSGMTYYEVF